MRKLDGKEIRHLLLRGIQELSRSILRDLAGAADKRERALDMAADKLMVRMADKDVYAPDPLKAHGEGL